MLTYLTFTLFHDRHHENSSKDAIYNLQCNSSKTRVSFQCKIDSKQLQQKQYRYEIPKNMFVGPSTDIIKVCLMKVNKQEDKKQQGIMYYGQLEISKLKKQKLTAEGRSYIVRDSLKLINEEDEQLLLEFKCKISRKEVYSGIIGYLPQEINFKRVELKERDRQEDGILRNPSKQSLGYNSRATNDDLQFDQGSLSISPEETYSSQKRGGVQVRRLRSKYVPQSLTNKGMAKIEEKQENLAAKPSPSQSKFISTANLTASDKDGNNFTSNKDNKKVLFYKGPCKSKNMFSCLDVAVEESQINMIQPLYYDETPIFEQFSDDDRQKDSQNDPQRDIRD